MKAAILFIGILLSFGVKAQDTLVMNNGDVVATDIKVIDSARQIIVHDNGVSEIIVSLRSVRKIIIHSDYESKSDLLKYQISKRENSETEI